MGGGLQTGLLSRFHLQRCHYCTRRMFFYKPDSLSDAQWRLRQPTRDHKVPKSKKKKNIIGNVVICCAWCNGLKGTSSYKEFFIWVKEYIKRRPR